MAFNHSFLGLDPCAPDSPHSRDVLLLKRFAADLIHVCLTINRHFLISIVFQYVRYVCTLHTYTPLVTYPVRRSIRPFWRGGRGGQIRTGDLRFPKPMRYQTALRPVALPVSQCAPGHKTDRVARGLNLGNAPRPARFRTPGGSPDRRGRCRARATGRR